VALVTGASGGIGRATTVRLLQAGYRVVGVDRRPMEEPSAGDGLRFEFADLREELEIRRILATVAGTEGRLDALVHNAAVQLRKPLEETQTEEWDDLMAVNLRAAFVLTRESLDLLRRQGGSVVHVASVHALATSTNVSAYAASKGGLLSLCRALAVELAPEGIRVNAVLPGAVDTQMLAEGLRARGEEAGEADPLRAGLASRTVLGRIGLPSEIAEAILFLVQADRSSFITGQSLVVDGGATARLSTE
jgi:NAD(P)-dependent dehydrogenase (short-subunit alcohol dehydrogenase family)